MFKFEKQQQQQQALRSAFISSWKRGAFPQSTSALATISVMAQTIGPSKRARLVNKKDSVTEAVTEESAAPMYSSSGGTLPARKMKLERMVTGLASDAAFPVRKLSDAEDCQNFDEFPNAQAPFENALLLLRSGERYSIQGMSTLGTHGVIFHAPPFLHLPVLHSLSCAFTVIFTHRYCIHWCCIHYHFTHCLYHT